MPSTPPDSWQAKDVRRIGTYLTAAAGGALVWGAMASWLPTTPHMTRFPDVIVTTLTLDVLVGVFTLALLPARHRFPLAIACLTAAPVAVSVASFGPALVAIATMATWRRWPWVVITGAVWFMSLLLGTVVYAPYAVGLNVTPSAVAINLLLGSALFVAAIAGGFYVGTRRDLTEALRERALTAARAAREAERTRIAREMHDVLAHRISLVALHAGALTYRADLTREHAAETAAVIHGNATLALTELREVLGVLRADDEPSQPTLGELAALLADVREAGGVVTVHTHGLVLTDVPETLSRTAFRIVQESLTNARKHAPGAEVDVRVSGGAGTGLGLSVRNPITAPVGEGTGTGLLGLAERAFLVGGTLTSGPRGGKIFEVKADLPWP
ncbi:histidine kinase [Lentzea sp. NPDC051838]|uniref:sensor histidine kinase n=1 Tax=Lentzea sp. NPDC051838 TaxID=3154849 RepID=UPI00342927ED